MSRRNLLTNLLLGQSEEKLAAANSGPQELAAANPPPEKRERVLAGPVRAMSLTLDRIEEESRALQEALATGAAVVELDPALIDASFIKDRLAEDDDATFAALKDSFAAHGQTVPILVRPHPSMAGRYQAAYGHRRLRAARELGVKIKAVVRDLDDRQLVVAQGIENSARRDLSFIERALFALALEEAGNDRPVIMAALSTDKTELSKMISVARALPRAIVAAIGPAPRAGRRRWMQLAELMKERDAARRVEKMLAGREAPADSDARFVRALAVAERPAQKPVDETVRRPDGAALARVKREANATVLRFDETSAPDFAAFVMTRLNDLYEEFRDRRS